MHRRSFLHEKAGCPTVHVGIAEPLRLIVSWVHRSPAFLSFSRCFVVSRSDMEAFQTSKKNSLRQFIRFLSTRDVLRFCAAEDVYKRQVLDRPATLQFPFFQSLRPWPGLGPGCTHFRWPVGPETVSYTHLDVYKRQVMGIVTLAIFAPILVRGVQTRRWSPLEEYRREQK